MSDTKEGAKKGNEAAGTEGNDRKGSESKSSIQAEAQKLSNGNGNERNSSTGGHRRNQQPRSSRNTSGPKSVGTEGNYSKGSNDKSLQAEQQTPSNENKRNSTRGQRRKQPRSTTNTRVPAPVVEMEGSDEGRKIKRIVQAEQTTRSNNGNKRIPAGGQRRNLPRSNNDTTVPSSAGTEGNDKGSNNTIHLQAEQEASNGNKRNTGGRRRNQPSSSSRDSAPGRPNGPSSHPRSNGRSNNSEPKSDATIQRSDEGSNDDKTTQNELTKRKELESTSRKQLHESETLSEARTKHVTSLNNSKGGEVKDKLDEGNNNTMNEELENTKQALQSAQTELSLQKQELEESERKSNARKEQLTSLNKKWRSRGKGDAQNATQEKARLPKENVSTNRALQAEQDRVRELEECTKKKEEAIQHLKELHQDTQTKLEQTTQKLEEARKELIAEQKGNNLLEEQLSIEGGLKQKAEKEIQKLINELKRADFSQPSNEVQAASHVHVAKLKRELQQTHEKLKTLESEKSKNDQKKAAPKREENNSVKNATIVLKKEEEKEVVTTAGSSDLARSTQRESAPIHFEKSDCETDDADIEVKERLEAELTFIASAYGEDEIRIEGSRVTIFLQLHIDRKVENVRVELILIIPKGYPALGTLAVEANIAQDSSGSAEARNSVMDSLASLVDVCRWEAQACEGYEALLNVLTSADNWITNDWAGIQRTIASQS